jgi:hypothetical protein
MRFIWRALAVTASAFYLCGCSTIIEGTSQRIAVATSPPGGYCSLKRDGQEIATVAQTPAEVTVDRTKDDILINCVASGYAPSSQYLHSGIATGVYGNIIIGGVVGWGVDSATGADNAYPSTVNLSMNPLSKDEAQIAAGLTQITARPCTREEADMKLFSQAQGYRYISNCY